MLRRLGAFVARLDPRSAEEEFQGIAEEAEKILEQMKEETLRIFLGKWM